jgi:hypothetical protein
MRALIILAGVIATFAAIVAAQDADPYAHLHEVCFHVPYSEFFTHEYVIDTDQHAGTTHVMHTIGKARTSMDFGEALVRPESGPWEQGVRFAAAMQANAVFPTSDEVVAAAWTPGPRRQDTFDFTLANGTVLSYTSTTCGAQYGNDWNNCQFRGGMEYHCWNNYENCCGWNTMNAQCVQKDETGASEKQCCTWFAAARTCELNDVCCGGLGVGASSYAACCPENSVCCHSRGTGTGTHSCCASGTTCCQGASVGLCCQSDETCDPDNNRCTGGSATTTTAPATVTPSAEPTTVPATSAPTTTPSAGSPNPATTTAAPTTTVPTPATTGSTGTTAGGSTAAPTPTTSGSTPAGSNPTTASPQSPATTSGAGSRLPRKHQRLLMAHRQPLPPRPRTRTRLRRRRAPPAPRVTPRRPHPGLR